MTASGVLARKRPQHTLASTPAVLSSPVALLVAILNILPDLGEPH